MRAKHARHTIFTLMALLLIVHVAHAGTADKPATLKPPAYGDMTSYINIRIYTDYLSEESAQANTLMAPLLPQLARYAIIAFADIPAHDASIAYSEAFLAAHNANPESLRNAMRVRQALFDAAMRTTSKDPMQTLKDAAIPLRYDRRQVAAICNNFYVPLIVQDNVATTPTVVVYKGTMRKAYKGATQIKNGLEALLETFKTAPETTAPPSQKPHR